MPATKPSEAEERIPKEEAVRRLRAAGYPAQADRLDKWRDKNGQNWGWDGHVRGTEPTLIDIIWPP